jgi:hypothetical protein
MIYHNPEKIAGFLPIISTFPNSGIDFDRSAKDSHLALIQQTNQARQRKLQGMNTINQQIRRKLFGSFTQIAYDITFTFNIQDHICSIRPTLVDTETCQRHAPTRGSSDC